MSASFSSIPLLKVFLLGCAQYYPKRETTIWELKNWIRGWESRQLGSASCSKRPSDIILTNAGEEPPEAKWMRLEILQAVKLNGFNRILNKSIFYNYWLVSLTIKSCQIRRLTSNKCVKPKNMNKFIVKH